MKVLYVDISLKGHREKYLEALVNDNDDAIALLPEHCDVLPCEQIIMKSGYDIKRDLWAYFKWLLEIHRIVKKEKIEMVHLLCGDALYRFFGIGLWMIGAPVVVTYHHMQFGKLRDFSLKRIFKGSFGVVHTEYIKEQLAHRGVTNVEKIEYPVFMENAGVSMDEAKKAIGLKTDVTSIVALGGTQKYKGVDILLKALQKVKSPFQLYLSGVIRDIKLETIQELIDSYSDKVILHMARLSDVEYQNAVSAADILVLPYRKEFDGASGPMMEAAWNRKFIVGANHGSMGRAINKHELGFTFETENIDDLALVIDRALNDARAWTDKAESFRNELKVDLFLEAYKKVYLGVMKR